MKIESENSAGVMFGNLEMGTVFKATASNLTWIKAELGSKGLENCVALENGVAGFIPNDQFVTYFPDATLKLGRPV